jgi:site-specific DNA-methyltransferase (adenine-specific)
MTPFYEEELVTLYCGDLRTLLPELDVSFDAVITNPPYGETSLPWDRWPDGWLSLIAAVSPQLWCFGSLRMFMKHAGEFREARWHLCQDLIWQKQNGSNSGNDRFRRVHETAAPFYRKDLPWESLYKSPQYVPDAVARTVRRKRGPPHWGEIGAQLYRSEDGGPKLQESVIFVPNCHGYAENETQKPEGIVRPLVRFSVPPGGSLLDPCAGSGTMLAVARELGIRSVGIEIRESQCELIVRRLSQLPLYNGDWR